MATQVNSVRTHNAGGMTITTLDLTLITSGTTVTYTFPANFKVRPVTFYNATTNAVNPTGATMTNSTGVWVSPTCAVNDNVIADFIQD